jgi:hypothetical protein
MIYKKFDDFFSFQGFLFFLKTNLELCLKMAPWKKCAQKAWKVPNTIEEQAIVVYSTLPSQGMSWKVHSKFAYGHIRTHP